MRRKLRRGSSGQNKGTGEEMKTTRFSIVTVVFLCVTSCTNPFPDIDEKWHKRSASRLDIRKATLECGAPNPIHYENGEFRNELNALASIHLCMVKSGFQYKNGPINWCRDRPEGRLPVCSEAIPTRNISRRLESPYCKRRTERSYCIKMSVNPASCERFDFANPPLECLP